MTTLSDIRRNTKIPHHIREHKTFSTEKKIKKVFPLIGLANFSEELDINNEEEMVPIINNLLTELRGVMSKPFGIIPERHVDAYYIANSFLNILYGQPLTFLNKNKENGRMTLNLPSSICGNRNILAKTGEGLFKAYNKVSECFKKANITLPNIDTLQTVKIFNGSNIPSIKCTITFSSDGDAGIWDITTMSMRGFGSCQSWGSRNSQHLIGSIVDPFTGIIYLTSGKDFEGKGPKMMRRCIVRMVVDKNSGKPKLLLERMFPQHSKDAAEKFVEILKRKTGGKFEVQDNSAKWTTGREGLIIPYVPITRELHSSKLPYRDSHIKFVDIIPTNKSQDAALLYKNTLLISDKICTSIMNVRYRECEPNEKALWKSDILTGTIPRICRRACMRLFITPFKKKISLTSKLKLTSKQQALSIIDKLRKDSESLSRTIAAEILKEIKVSNKLFLSISDRIEEVICREIEKDLALLMKTDKVLAKKHPLLELPKNTDLIDLIKQVS